MMCTLWLGRGPFSLDLGFRCRRCAAGNVFMEGDARPWFAYGPLWGSDVDCGLLRYCRSCRVVFLCDAGAE